MFAAAVMVRFLWQLGWIFVGVWCFFLTGFGVFLGVPRCFKPRCPVERIFRSTNQNVELFYSLNSKAPNNYKGRWPGLVTAWAMRAG